MEGGGAPGVGSKCVTTRRIGLAERPITSEITQIAPPRGWAVHGLDGPIRATVNVTVEPLDENARSRLTIALDFEGHGIGKLLVLLVVRREARKEMPVNLRTLKDRLEARGSERHGEPPVGSARWGQADRQARHADRGGYSNRASMLANSRFSDSYWPTNSSSGIPGPWNIVNE
jgi:hypothetical protein